MAFRTPGRQNDYQSPTGAGARHFGGPRDPPGHGGTPASAYVPYSAGHGSATARAHRTGSTSPRTAGFVPRGSAASPVSGGNRHTAAYDAAVARDTIRAHQLAPPAHHHGRYQHGAPQASPGIGPDAYNGYRHQQHQQVYAGSSRRASSSSRAQHPGHYGTGYAQHQYHQQHAAGGGSGRHPPRRSGSATALRGHVDPYAHGPAPSATPARQRGRGIRNDDLIEEVRNGQVVHRYRCGRCLGRGGFATVFEFTDVDSGARYAAKVIDTTKMERSKLEKLEREIRIHQQLEHENVVRIHGHFRDSSYMYLLLEKCDNQSLYELSRARISLTVPEVQYIMLQLLRGVEYLHRSNVIHRDLKLANVLVDECLNIKIADFGLAAALSHTEETKRSLCGTPNYIAPEILAQEDRNSRRSRSATPRAPSPLAAQGYNYRADYWSLGVILYTLFVGCPPFETPEIHKTYELIRHAEYTIPPNVPVEAQRLIRRILRVDPASRPSLVEMRRDPFFAGCAVQDMPPETLIEYAARLHSRSVNDVRATIIEHRQLHATPSAAQRDGALDNSDSTPQTGQPRAERRLFATPQALDREALTREHAETPEPRDPLETSPVSRAPPAYGNYRGTREAELSPLAGTSPMVGGTAFPATRSGASSPTSDAGADRLASGLLGPPASHAAGGVARPRPQGGAMEEFAKAISTLLSNRQSAAAVMAQDPAFSIAPLAERTVPADFVVLTELMLNFKYGFGYRTSAGHTGVYFNDKTRIVFDDATMNAEFFDKAPPRGGQEAAEEPTVVFNLQRQLTQPDPRVNAKKAKLGEWFARVFSTRSTDVQLLLDDYAANPEDTYPPSPSLPVPNDADWGAISVQAPPVLTALPGFGLVPSAPPRAYDEQQEDRAASFTAHVARMPTLATGAALGSMVHVRRSLSLAIPEALSRSPDALPPQMRLEYLAEALRPRAAQSYVLNAAISALPVAVAMAKLSNGDTQLTFFESEFALAQQYNDVDQEKATERSAALGIDPRYLFDPNRPFPPMVAACATLILSRDDEAFTVVLPETRAAIRREGATSARFATFSTQAAFALLHKVAAARGAAEMLRRVGSAERSLEVLQMSDADAAGPAGAQLGRSEEDSINFSLAAAVWLHRAYGAAELAQYAHTTPRSGGFRLHSDAPGGQ